MNMFILDISILVTLYMCFVLQCEAYSRGAPPTFCQFDSLAQRKVLMKPGHGGIEPSNGRLPAGYRIEVSPYVGDGLSRRVTLRAAPGDYFKGFFIQAINSNHELSKRDRAAYGTFVSVDRNSQPRRCSAAVGQVGGITHTGNLNKTEVSVDWIPPRGCNLGAIQFIATVVRSYSEYWVDIRSDVVNPSGFEGRRGLLCRLYVDPYNAAIQAEVLGALRSLERRGGRRRG